MRRIWYNETMRFIILAFLFGTLAFSVTLAASLDPPTLVYPTSEDSPVWKGQIRFQWETTAPFSEYHINLPTGESEGKIISSLQKTFTGLPIGEYSWVVRSCGDAQGAGCGEWSELQVFKIAPAPPGTTGGLIPCGRQYDDTIATPGIDESEPCRISHLILLLKNVLDFTLWRLGLIIIAIMAVLTGAVSYFSFGRPEIILRIKSIWKSVFIGYLIALFAWLAVNVILNVLGFEVRLFGTWWQLPF